jgi:hypothetical protein
VLNVQADWRSQKLKITIDPTGRMTAAYGKQRQSHTLTKANKTGTCRHVEILATMAVHGAWQPSSLHSEVDKKAFKRLQAELQAILPLPVVSVTSEMGRSGLKASCCSKRLMAHRFSQQQFLHR